LQNAASVAGLLITTEAMIYERGERPLGASSTPGRNGAAEEEY
jgi:chaperonin GroEL (HSP60 family)